MITKSLYMRQNCQQYWKQNCLIVLSKSDEEFLPNDSHSLDSKNDIDEQPPQTIYEPENIEKLKWEND